MYKNTPEYVPIHIAWGTFQLAGRYGTQATEWSGSTLVG